MEKELIGKFLVRRAKLKSGTNCLILCGSFIPLNFDIAEIDSTDEMWVCEISIKPGGKRFRDNLNRAIGVGSPEDFLDGNGQDADNWYIEDEL